MNENRFTGITASDYDLTKLIIPHHDEFQDAVASALFSYFDSRPDLPCFRVLEIGCGTGETTKRLFADERIHMLAAVDASAEMIRIALDEYQHQWKHMATAEHQVHFFDKDALSYLNQPYRWNTHAIVSCWTLHNIHQDERAKIVKAAYDRIDEGGCFVLGDKIAPDDSAESARIYQEVLKRCDIYDEISRPDFKEEWLEHLRKDDQPEYRWTQRNVEGTLRDVGFKDVRMKYRKEFETVYVAIK